MKKNLAVELPRSFLQRFLCVFRKGGLHGTPKAGYVEVHGRTASADDACRRPLTTVAAQKSFCGRPMWGRPFHTLTENTECHCAVRMPVFASPVTPGGLSSLLQAEMYRQVSRATGDPVAEIERRGFVPLTPFPVERDHDRVQVDLDGFEMQWSLMV